MNKNLKIRLLADSGMTLTLKFLLALMVVMHETLNKVTDYNPRVNTEKQTETSAGEEKFL